MLFNTFTPSGGICLDDDIRNTKPGISVSKPFTADLKMFQNDQWKFSHNQFVAYLNINSFRNKVIDLGEILKDFTLDYFVIFETKLDESFSNVQLKDGYEVRTRRDRHKHGGGLIEFVRKVFTWKILKEYEPNCSQFQRKGWSILVYIGLHQREILKHSLKK